MLLGNQPTFRERLYANRGQYILTAGILIIVAHLIVALPIAPMITDSVIFGLLLWGAGRCRSSLTLKYVMSCASLAILVAGLMIYDVPMGYVGQFAFYITLIYASVLPDFYSPNIVGAAFVLVFLHYWGTTATSEIINRILGVVGSSLSYSIIFHLMRRLTQERDRYHKASLTDSLTSLSSLEHAMQVGQSVIESGFQTAVMVLDVDNFKQINDTYGHLAGNNVLIQISDLLKKELTELNALLGRLGGDEFVIILRDYSMEQAQIVKDRLNKSIEQGYFQADGDLVPIRLTCSIGLAHCTANSRNEFQELIHAADVDMFHCKYESKKRNEPGDDAREIELPDNLRRLLDTMSEKDMYTVVHSKHVAIYAQALGQALHLNTETLNQLYLAGLLHDLGKLSIPNRILRKPAALSEDEFDIIRQHTIHGLGLLSCHGLQPAVTNAIKYHHERWDGSGYPFGIPGKTIPLEARILQLADAYSAMSIKRVYCEKLPLEEVISEIRKCSGSQFDPDIAKVFIDMLAEKAVAL